MRCVTRLMTGKLCTPFFKFLPTRKQPETLYSFAAGNTRGLIEQDRRTLGRWSVFVLLSLLSIGLRGEWTLSRGEPSLPTPLHTLYLTLT